MRYVDEVQRKFPCPKGYAEFTGKPQMVYDRLTLRPAKVLGYLDDRVRLEDELTFLAHPVWYVVKL